MKMMNNVLSTGFALSILAAPGFALDRDEWECRDGLCTSIHATEIAVMKGQFDYGANISRDGNPTRTEELSAQRHRRFSFEVTRDLRLYLDVEENRDYQPADWPKDISLGNVHVAGSLHAGPGYDEVKPLQNGAIVKGGSTVVVFLAQDTWGFGSNYATFYPADWTARVSYRDIRLNANWDAPDADHPLIGASDGVSLIGAGQPSAQDDLIEAIDNALNCRDRECREPDLVPVPDDTPIVEPDPDQDCGADMMECRPNDGVEPVKPDAPEPDPIARLLQTELQRVGCYEAALDGLWGPASRRAMANYNHWSGQNLPEDEASPEALVAVSKTSHAVCGVD